MKRRLAQQSLKARALQLLSQREHSRLELRRKLLAHAGKFQACAAAQGEATTPDDAASTRRAPPSTQTLDEVDALLDGLAASGLLSEARFVETRVRSRVARHGNLRIRQELAQHGLELSPAEAQALQESEFTRAREVWARKFSALPGDAAERARQMRFLASRGFSADVIRKVLRHGGEGA